MPNQCMTTSQLASIRVSQILCYSLFSKRLVYPLLNSQHTGFTVEQSESDHDWRATLSIDEVSEYLLATGYSHSTKISDKQEVIASLIEYHCMTKVWISII